MKVRAKESTIVGVDGAMFNVREGEAFDSKDPVVKAHGWLFVDDIEDTSAAPGRPRGAR